MPSMIAPTPRGCKGANGARFPFDAAGARSGRVVPRRHVIVSSIIMPPQFCQAPAALNCKMNPVRWPGPFGSGFLSPQPPGAVGIGPVPHQETTAGPTRVGPFLLGGVDCAGVAPANSEQW